MPLRIGETFAEYRVLRLLGSGGMGDVYLAQHPRLPRHDALKVLRTDVSSDTSFQERFIREADLAAGLRHPHIVGIHDRGEQDGQLWIAMDYIDGTDAAQLIQQRYPAGMPAELAISIITAVASALDHAQRKGLLHRDVKPANIIVADLATDEQQVFLADFGIARPIDDISGITTTNMTVGTIAYAAPEQLLGEEMDGRADQYALAATAYHLLTGLQLFPHTNPAVVISRHLNINPPTLGDRRPDCAGLDDVLQIALAKNPADRFPSCSAFAQALLDESPEPGAASARATTQAAPQPRKSATTSAPRPHSAPPADRSRHARMVLGSVAAIVLLIGLVAVVWRPWDSQQSTSAGTTSTMATTSAPSPPSTATPPVALPTITVTAPSPLSPTLTLEDAPDRGAIEQDREADYVAAFRGAVDAGQLSWSVLPNSGHSTDEQMVEFGHEACAVMDRYPSSLARAASILYQEHGFNGPYTDPGYVQFMSVATILCPKHAHEQ
jgi:serine/threonine-protein kinase